MADIFGVDAPYSNDSLLAYDPDEERRKKAAEDHKAAADLGKRQTQGSTGQASGYFGSVLGDLADVGSKALTGLADLQYGYATKPKSIATPQPRPIPQPRMQIPAADAGGRSSELDQIEQAYNQKIQEKEHPALGFSWGGAPTKDYRPGTDIRSGQFGQAPTEDSSRRAPFSAPSTGTYTDRQSRGGGGFLSGGGGELNNLSSFEDWNSRVSNPAMFSGAMEALERPGMEAEQARNRALAKDPFLLQELQSREKIAEKTAPEEMKQAQSQYYFQRAMAIQQSRKDKLDALHKSPKWALIPTPEARAAAEAEATADEDHADDVLDFELHGKTRRQQKGLLAG